MEGDEGPVELCPQNLRQLRGWQSLIGFVDMCVAYMMNELIVD